MAKERKRLNLDLTPEAYDLLKKLSEESGKNMADVLRTGLALYGIAQEEGAKGRDLAVIDENEKVVKQIVVP
ncbi:ribbon-helix-helix copg family [Leptolyngbya sp. Heron Island J]|uniref:ribbon-helix-helix copg family n=1 Tax=Leptolyngbya sp. Heron Island J TaxID=1385935 RepID=UPI0003B98EBC|nr:ribbon-helix-helix copg family [Leptolyngbya sp. Heron Island J]ESA32759.1 ribbon-helix-helix copg family [Leptolyngbya sp. Heron Island J]